MITACVQYQNEPAYDRDTNEIILKLWTIFWNTDDDPTVSETAEVQVRVAATAALNTIRDAITDALVDAASNNWAWTLPRTRCLQPAFERGLII